MSRYLQQLIFYCRGPWVDASSHIEDFGPELVMQAAPGARAVHCRIPPLEPEEPNRADLILRPMRPSDLALEGRWLRLPGAGSWLSLVGMLATARSGRVRINGNGRIKRRM